MLYKKTPPTGYYINILCIDKQHNKVSLLYPINPAGVDSPYIILTPKGSTDLKDFLFITQPNIVYLLVATTDSYDSHSLYSDLNSANLSQPHNELYKDYIITY